jgi:uncharacterized membrane protein YdjX (TVP38/TMEM64 family)
MPNRTQSAALPNTSNEEKSMNNVENSNSVVSSRIKRWAPIIIVLAILTGGYFAGLNEYFSLEFITANRDKLMMRVEDNYILSLVAYFFIYTIAVAVSFPGASLITVISGFLFGWFAGGLTTVFAATLGASIIFLAARTSFGDILQKKAGKRMTKLSKGFQRDAFSYLFTLRLAPIFPFWLINLAPALFGMKLMPYVIATFFGIIPGTFAYAYLGQGLGSTIRGDGSFVTPTLVAALAVLALVSLIPIVIKRLKKRKLKA